MDPTLNPYSPGAGSPPPALVGRDAEIEIIRVAIERLRLGRSEKSFMLTGLRGVGKTVLLQEFVDLGLRRHWACELVEASPTMKFQQVVADVVQRVLLRLSPAQTLAARARRALGVLKSFKITWNLPEMGEVAVGLDPVPGHADSGSLDADLAALLIEVGEMAGERGRGFLFALDEVQYLSRKNLGALIAGLHRVHQKQLPLLLIGAGLPSLPALAAEARTYAERLFAFRTINSLGGADARAALELPAEREGVVWRPEALDQIVDRTKGYPYFLQEFGKQAWNAAADPGEITPSAVETALPIAVDELDRGLFCARTGRATDAEREYLVAMASLGKGPYASADVAAKLGKSTRKVGSLRSRLIKKGLCYSLRYGEIDFTVPLFDDFVRRRLAGDD